MNDYRYRKIANMTWFFGGANYGQTLQAFALNLVMRKMGNLVLLQNMDSDYAYFNEIIGEEPLMYSADQISLLSPEQEAGWIGYNEERKDKRWLQFDLFIRKHLNVFPSGREKDTLEKKIKSDDIHIIVCGGDQIWNPNYKPFDIFTAKFPSVDKVIKISYSPSVGVKRIDKDKQDLFDHFCRHIQEFGRISIREESGAELIRESWRRQGLDEKEIVRVLDPVFLLTAAEWAELCRTDKEKNDCINHDYNGYILCYFVGKAESRFAQIRDIAQKKELPIHLVEMNEPYETAADENMSVFSGLSPLEFVSQVAGADYIIGDSYHVAVFSIIFQKQFVLFPREDIQDWHYEDDDRFDAMFSLFHMDSRVINDYGEFIRLPEISYKEVFDILSRERKNSIDYLDESLSYAREQLFLWDRMEDFRVPYGFPEDLANKGGKIILYGAGGVGVDYWCQCRLFAYADVVLWMDRENRYLEKGISIASPDTDISKVQYDYILIAIRDKQTVSDIIQSFEKKGIFKEKILWREPKEKADAFLKQI